MYSKLRLNKTHIDDACSAEHTDQMWNNESAFLKLLSGIKEPFVLFVLQKERWLKSKYFINVCARGEGQRLMKYRLKRVHMSLALSHLTDYQIALPAHYKQECTNICPDH